MQGRKLFQIFKPLIFVIYMFFRILPKFLFTSLWPILDILPGYLGLISRYLFAKKLAKKIGDNVSIGRSVEIKNWEHLTIGSNVSIHKDCYIEAIGGVVIGDDVSIAHASSILSSEHTWEHSDIPIRSNPLKVSPVSIDNDVWIGCGVRILSGVTISSRVVVASGAVVTKSIESNLLVAGVPAIKKKDIN